MMRRRRRWLVGVPLAVIGFLWFWWLLLPWPVLLRWRDPGSTSFIEMRPAQAHVAGEEFDLVWTPVPLAEISPLLRRAVILA